MSLSATQQIKQCSQLGVLPHSKNLQMGAITLKRLKITDIEEISKDPSSVNLWDYIKHLTLVNRGYTCKQI